MTRRRSTEENIKIVEDFKKSGLPMSRFAPTIGMSANALWNLINRNVHVKEALKAKKKGAGKFVSLNQNGNAESHSPKGFEVSFKGAVIKVQDLESLKEVLSLVESTHMP